MELQGLLMLGIIFLLGVIGLITAIKNWEWQYKFLKVKLLELLIGEKRARLIFRWGTLIVSLGMIIYTPVFGWKHFTNNSDATYNDSSSCVRYSPKDEMEKILLSIPQERLFQYYKGSIKTLVRHCNENTIYFTYAGEDTRMYVDNTVAINFNDQLSEAEIKRIFEKESLEVDNFSEWETYYVSTTNLSEFTDGLQEANYLMERYGQLIEFAHPYYKWTYN